MDTLVTTKLNSALCIALDTPDLARARRLAHEVTGVAGMVKVGMEFFYAHGATGYGAVAAAGVPIFLDLKLHDIPNTVAGAPPVNSPVMLARTAWLPARARDPL
jgi:orotidine-5'-phosphate decarboxylase